MSDTSFLEKVDSGFTPGDLETLGAHLELLAKTRDELEVISKQLKEKAEQERLMSRETIPDFLLSRGLSEVKLSDGRKVEVKEKLACSVPKQEDKKRRVLKWLIEQGGESIIDQNAVIPDPEKGITDYLLKNNIPFRKDVGVHHMRFRSFISEKLGLKKGSIATIDVTDVPEEVNLFIYKETILK